MKYKKAVVGGTFDYLHDGHKEILAKAFEIGERVLVGITSDQMLLEKDSVGIQPLDVRREKLEEFLCEKGWFQRADIEVISDPVGPSADDEDLEAIVVTEETKPRAEEINELRVERGLDHLEIVEVPFVLAEDGRPISSVRVRYGEIDVHGKLKGK